MDNLIEALDAALLRAGLSNAAASQAAVGNASAIKNLRMQRGAEKRYNYVTLQKLADLLELELYFGPRRSDIPQGQAAGFMEVRDPALFHDLPRDDANRQFLPLPFSSRGGADRGVTPIAFMRGWFIERDLAPDDLRMVPLATIAWHQRYRQGRWLLWTRAVGNLTARRSWLLNITWSSGHAGLRLWKITTLQPHLTIQMLSPKSMKQVV
jgi:hypothetical protein